MMESLFSTKFDFIPLQILNITIFTKANNLRIYPNEHI
jgi:hypothetical protein